MISARFGPMPVTLRRVRQIQHAQLLVQAAHLVSGRAHAVGLVALGARDAVHRADHRRGRGRSGDHAIPSRIAQPLSRCPPASPRYTRASGAARAARADRCCRKISRSRTAPSGFENESRSVPCFAGDHLRAAAADIDNQQPAVRMRPARLHAQVNQPRLLASGNDLDRRRRWPARRARGTRPDCACRAPRWWPRARTPTTSSF